MRKLTTEEFIARAREVHGDKYDYSKVVYKNNKSYVTIICPVHGEFSQIAQDHMRGIGCRKCGGTAPLDTETFIAKARELHNDKYDYHKTLYKNIDSKVIIICPIHGEFTQAPKHHLNGMGCDMCARKVAGKSISEKMRKDKEYFIKRAKEIHGDLYDYSLVDYKSIHKKVKIICKRCGTHFEQAPEVHYRGAGCPQCSERAQSDHVYLLVDSEHKPTRMKIGITCNLKQRLKNLRLGNKHVGLQPTPFKIFKRACYKVGPGEAYKIEQLLHKYYASRNLGYTGFDGATEWFEYDAQAEKLLAEIATNKMKTSA